MSIPRATDRLTFRGRTFDQITMAGILHWEYCLGHLLHRDTPVQLDVLQGPYSMTVAASGNTHAGSGAADVDRPAPATWGQTAWAGRLAGWFASVRLASQGPWQEHVHAVQVGNKGLSSAAALQVSNWENFDDAGLVGDDKDAMRDPDPIVSFRYPLGRVNLEHVRAEFTKTRGWEPLPGVRHMQQALNLKTGSQLVVDGIAGPKTRRQLAAWEDQHGGDGDGIPGPLLWLLGSARFEVH